MRFVIARNEALIFHGEKLNAFFAARRVNYKEVIHNLLQTTPPLKKIATLLLLQASMPSALRAALCAFKIVPYDFVAMTEFVFYGYFAKSSLL